MTSRASKQYDSWGASNEGSSAITGESAKLLGLSGYRGGNAKAVPVARGFLKTIKGSRPTTKRLYSGHAKLPTLTIGATVTLPLTALSDDEDFARTFATDSEATLLVFVAGIRAMRYSDVEWITAGRFTVKAVKKGRDPYWGTALKTVILAPAARRR